MSSPLVSIVAGAIDPVLGSMVVALIGLAGAIVTGLITARASADRVLAQDRIRRAKRRIRELERAAGVPAEEAWDEED